MVISRYHSGVTPLEKVLAEVARYEHPLFRFAARERDDTIELVIESKEPGLVSYRAPIHPQDIEHAQFPWTFQRYLYDCLHDYVVEMFVRNPQIAETRS